MKNERQLVGKPIDKTGRSSASMVIENFRAAAAGQGKYCPLKNELRVRKKGKVFRFTCGEHQLRFAGPGLPDVIYSLAFDAKVEELRRCITELTASSEQHESGSFDLYRR